MRMGWLGAASAWLCMANCTPSPTCLTSSSAASLPVLGGFLADHVRLPTLLLHLALTGPSCHTQPPQYAHAPPHPTPPSSPHPRRAFNEVYLPWLNELPPPRLEAEFSTLHSYLRLLEGGMGSEVVRGLMGAYVRAIVQKAAR